MQSAFKVNFNTAGHEGHREERRDFFTLLCVLRCLFSAYLPSNYQ
jgi:hypothetical protein